MMKRNILILADTLEVYGGAERHVLDLVKYMNQDRYNLFVASLIPGGRLLQEISSFGACVSLFPLKRIYSIFGIFRGFAFVRFLKRNKIDILMTIHFGSDIWGTIFGRIAGVPVVISNRRDTGFWKKKRHILAYKLINKYVNRIIVNSNSGKSRIINDEGITAEKISVIYGAVDIRTFQAVPKKEELRKSLGISPNKTIIGSVGNFNPIKGHKYLIEAAADIVKEIPNAHFLLVGDGPLRNSLWSIVNSRGLEDKVTFLGSRKEIPDILSVMDICVLPSLSEGLSNALMEYMAAGKAIIATRVGGNPELIENGISGILIEPGSANEIAKAVVGLVGDKEKAARLAENVRKKAEQELGMPAMISKYEGIFSQKCKRILHLISSNGLFGAERVLLNVADFNSRDGALSIVGAIRNSHNPHIEVIAEAKKRGLVTAVFTSQERFDFKTIGQIKDYIRKNDIELIHTHNYKSDILGFIASRLTRAKWVATNHVWHGTDRKLKMYELIDGFILRFADKAIAVSDEIVNDLLKGGVDKDKIKKIYNGIEVEDCGFKSEVLGLRDEFGIEDNDVVVTTIGRLSPEKGHEILLQAAAAITKKRNHIKFLIVGDGPLRNSLWSIVNSRGLQGKVIFTGIRDDIARILSISDIYVNSSYIEGLPLTILEAMRARLPVVATKAGATAEIITHDKTGILLDCGDAQGLAREIDSLLSDSKKRQRLSEQAYLNLREQFSLERMGRDYQDLYQEVLP